MDFATELVSENDVSSPGDPGSLRTDRTAVKTGDDTEITRYLLLMLVSGALLFIAGIIMLRRQQEEGAKGGEN